MQDVDHNHFIISAVSRQPKPQSHVSISVGLATDASSEVTNHPLFSLGILRVPFELSPISANARSCGTIQLLSLLRWALSVRNCHPIVLNRCRCHCCGCGCSCRCWCRCGCRCLCRCSAHHRCSAWTIPCNVPHLMASVAFLSTPAAMLLTLRTTTIPLSAMTTGHLGLPSLL
jgi:hypothetical protein